MPESKQNFLGDRRAVDALFLRIDVALSRGISGHFMTPYGEVMVRRGGPLASAYMKGAGTTFGQTPRIAVLKLLERINIDNHHAANGFIH